MKKNSAFVLAVLMLTAASAFSQTSAEYYIGVNGQLPGPYDIAALKDMVQAGTLTRTSLIWKVDGFAEAATIPEIAALFNTPQPIPDSPQYPDAARAGTKKPARIPDKILSAGTLSKEHLVNFLLARNPALAAGRTYVGVLIASYIEYANRDGVNYEIAFAQMCHHTNYLSFKKTFAPEGSYNFAGFSSPYNRYGVRAHRFNSLEEGVRAHIQHLKGYATSNSPVGVIVDPRYTLIKEQYGLGSSPTLAGLEGKWSPEKDYGRALQDILVALYETAKK